MNVRKSMHQKRTSHPQSKVVSQQNGIIREFASSTQPSSEILPRERTPRRSSATAASSNGGSALPSQMLFERDRERHSSGRSGDGDAPDTMWHMRRSATKLFTGSTYNGTWNQFGFNGIGTYRFPDGVEYDGQLHNGQFHGNGTLTYANGTMISGHWRHGLSTHLSLQFADGLMFRERDWNYCVGRDKRFATDEMHVLAPIGDHRRQPRRMDRDTIPPGCYNTGEGFYNPHTKCLYSHADPAQILRIPTDAEERWIVANCPTAWDVMSDGRDADGLEDTDYGRPDEEFMFT